MALSLNKIEQIAPDQASLSAAKKLLAPAKWPMLEEGGDQLIWGECQGSGSTPYRVVVSESDTGYKCTCPSRKFPCKHALALMWIRAEGLAPFGPGSPPQWVADWLGRRRDPGKAPAGKPSAKPADTARSGPRPSISATRHETEPDPTSPEALARAEAARRRNAEKREALVAGGIAAMEQWIEDQLARGLASFGSRAAGDCATLAKRLVDAKAGGLANRISALPAQLFALDEQHRPLRAAQTLAGLYLMGQAYTRQAELDADLRADLRQQIGWSVTREALLSDPAASRVGGQWRVMAARDEVQPDRLRRIETWLAQVGGDGRNALLLDFVPVSGGASGTMFECGEVLDAELAFYPSPVPLRAQIADHRGTQGPDGSWEGTATTLADGLEGWRRAIARKPWIEALPLGFGNARVRTSGGRLFACSGEDAVPIAQDLTDGAAPLAEAGTLSLFGLWDGDAFEPLLAATALGEWSAA